MSDDVSGERSGKTRLRQVGLPPPVSCQTVNKCAKRVDVNPQNSVLKARVVVRLHH